MKTATSFLFLVILLPLHPLSSQAQFLKSLMNNVTQSMANKAAGNKTTTTTKGDSTTHTGLDSASLRKMMAGLNKPKPSISPADSAAAIKAFTSGGGGSGIFCQYQVTNNLLKAKKQSLDTMSMSYCDGGYSRVDFGGVMGIGSALIGRAAQPKYSVMLNAQNKTYILNIVDTAALNNNNATYQVTKIGNETAQGYSCVHFKLTITYANSTPIVEDIWTSKDVPGYSEMSKMMTVKGVTIKMLQVIEQAGCLGSFVKLTMLTKDISMSMVLMTASRKTFPASAFQIPAGYKESSYFNSLFPTTAAPK